LQCRREDAAQEVGEAEYLEVEVEIVLQVVGEVEVEIILQLIWEVEVTLAPLLVIVVKNLTKMLV
jgi:hypothetical protein